MLPRASGYSTAIAQSGSDVVNPQNEEIISITGGEGGILDIESRAFTIPWPQSYLDVYTSVSLTATAAVESAIPASASSAGAEPFENIQLPALLPRGTPPTAFFTAERAIGPTPASTVGAPSPSSNEESAAVMDQRVTSGVLYSGFTTAAAAMVLEVFAPRR
ncbi:MAG: hypothetical protein Q9188_005844 [Gyalolechia gomerana]